MAREHANVVAPPPLLTAPFLVAGVLLRLWIPLRLFPDALIGHAAGWPLILASVALMVWSVRTMTRQRESPDVYRPTNKLTTSGSFAFSRNPIYLAFILAHLGAGLAVNTLWHVILLPAPLALLHYGVIAREERYLSRRFGDEYQQYRARVRRWL